MPVAAPFADLAAAGRDLADALAADGNGRHGLVVGIVRGGAPAAFEIARRLRLPLDVLLMRTLVMRTSGQLLRATNVAGTMVLDEGCHLLPPGSVERLVADEGVRALSLRTAACRGSRQPVDVADRIIILVDNGMRTGGTMAAAIRAVRTMHPRSIVAATPVAAASAVEVVRPLVDQLVCVMTPPSLGNVAMAYQRFDVPDEAQIHDLLERV